MKKVLSLVLAFVMGLSLCACGGEASGGTNTSTTTPPTETVSRYDEGEYIVGKDLPAGEYVIFPKGEYHFRLFSDSRYTKTLADKNSGSYNYLMLKDEQCLIVYSGYLVPIEKAEINPSSNSAIFKVGVNIEPGEYTFICDNSFPTGLGDDIRYLWYVKHWVMEDNGTLGTRDYCGISASSYNYFTYTYTDASLVEYDTVNYDITLTEGEYVSVVGGYLLKK